MIKKIMAFGLIVALTTSQVAVAKDEVTINDSFEISGQDTLQIDFSVGSIEVRTYQGDTVEVDIEIEENDSSFFSSGPDLDDIELKVKNKIDTLSLSIREDDLKQTWVVKVPENMALEIDLDVGDVEVSNVINDVRVDLGVGSALVEIGDTNYRRIHLDSGVGDTSIRGFDGNVTTERVVVASSSIYRGEGEHRIQVDVGVGDAKVRRF